MQFGRWSPRRGSPVDGSSLGHAGGGETVTDTLHESQREWPASARLRCGQPGIFPHETSGDPARFRLRAGVYGRRDCNTVRPECARESFGPALHPTRRAIVAADREMRAAKRRSGTVCPPCRLNDHSMIAPRHRAQIGRQDVVAAAERAIAARDIAEPLRAHRPAGAPERRPTPRDRNAHRE
jgi:hypothetical protein